MSPPSFSDYPRDLVGYGRAPPDPRWPGKRPSCGPVRGEFRGGRREHDLARRCGVRSVSVGRAGGRAVARPASHERGIDVRIRLARRILAPVAAVHRAQNSGDRFRGGERARPQSSGGSRHARSRLGDCLPRPEMDRLQRFFACRGSVPHARGDPSAHRGDRRAAFGLVHRPQLGAHAQARARRRRLPLFFRFLCRRPALLGERT